MRLCYTLIFVLVWFQSSFCQETVNGYVVLPNDDTLNGIIKLGGIKRATTNREVTMIDSNGMEKKYRAQEGEVKAFGTEILGINKHYVFFKLKQKADSQWFERICTGKKYSLYLTRVTGSFGTVDVTSPWFVLQKANGSFVFLENCALCGWRKNLTEFLTDDQEILSRVEDIKAKELGTFLYSICK